MYINWFCIFYTLVLLTNFILIFDQGVNKNNALKLLLSWYHVEIIAFYFIIVISIIEKYHFYHTYNFIILYFEKIISNGMERYINQKIKFWMNAWILNTVSILPAEILSKHMKGTQINQCIAISDYFYKTRICVYTCHHFLNIIIKVKFYQVKISAKFNITTIILPGSQFFSSSPYLQSS